MAERVRPLSDLFDASEEERTKLTHQELRDIGLQVANKHLASLGYTTMGYELLIDGEVVVQFQFENETALCRIEVTTFPRDPLYSESLSEALSAREEPVFMLGITLAHELEAFDPEATEGLPPMRGFGVLPKVGELRRYR